MSCYPVVASYIDKYQFGFQCPFCSLEHIHGNCNDYLTNRYEYRGSHCDNYEGEFKILITKETERRLNRRDMNLYKNYNHLN